MHVSSSCLFVQLFVYSVHVVRCLFIRFSIYIHTHIYIYIHTYIYIYRVTSLAMCICTSTFCTPVSQMIILGAWSLFAWKVYLVSGTRVVSGVSGFWASSTLGRELGDKMRGRGLGPGTIFSSEYAKP